MLDDVTYTFEGNHQYALTGVSGIGKSTLMQVLAGLDKPDGGSVLCNGIDIYALEPHLRSRFIQEHIGFVFQYPSLIEELSVLENVMLKGLIADQPYAHASEMALFLLEKVGWSLRLPMPLYPIRWRAAACLCCPCLIYPADIYFS